MAISRVKDWVNAEILSHTDLNAEFNNVTTQLLPAATQNQVDTMSSLTVGLHPNHNKIIQGTAQASTSGTAITFSSIPAGVRRITVHLSGVSTGGTSNLLIRLGDSGGIESSAYLGACTTTATATPSTTNFTTGVGLTSGVAAASVLHGAVVFTLMSESAFTWSAFGVIAYSNAATCGYTAAIKSLSAELTQISVTSVTPDTFDAGSINISYER